MLDEKHGIEIHGIEDWELLARFARSYRSLSAAFMRQIDIPRTQAIVLHRLFIQEGLTQSELAQLLGVQGATVTGILQRMEEAGFISRHRDPDDNRLVRICLTDLGREKERLITQQTDKLEKAIFSAFEADERAQLRRYLARALDNISAASSR